MATLAEAQSQLAAWEAASEALASSQSYSIGGRTLTRADWPAVQAAMTHWQRVVDGLTAVNSGARTGRIKTLVVPT